MMPAPSGTVTLAGTMTEGLLLESVSVSPADASTNDPAQQGGPALHRRKVDREIDERRR